MSGPFPRILHRKIRKYVKYSRIFLFCLNEKVLAQNCFARKKRFFRVGRGEKRRNTGVVFRAFSTKPRREKILFALSYPYSARPKGALRYSSLLDHGPKGGSAAESLWGRLGRGRSALSHQIERSGFLRRKAPPPPNTNATQAKSKPAQRRAEVVDEARSGRAVLILRRRSSGTSAR